MHNPDDYLATLDEALRAHPSHYKSGHMRTGCLGQRTEAAGLADSVFVRSIEADLAPGWPRVTSTTTAHRCSAWVAL